MHVYFRVNSNMVKDIGYLVSVTFVLRHSVVSKLVVFLHYFVRYFSMLANYTKPGGGNQFCNDLKKFPIQLYKKQNHSNSGNMIVLISGTP